MELLCFLRSALSDYQLLGDFLRKFWLTKKPEIPNSHKNLVIIAINKKTEMDAAYPILQVNMTK